jgi:uncharacterized protein YtpQ (UPF0354 family)
MASAADIPTDESGFTNYVAEKLRHALQADVHIAGPLTLMLSAGRHQANLDRIYLFCRNNLGDCGSEVDNYIKTTVDIYRDQNSRPTKESIRLIVRRAQYVQEAPCAGSTSFPVWPLGGGLVVVLAMDMPRAIQMLNLNHIAGLGLTANQAYELGVENLQKALKPLKDVAPPITLGEIGSIAEDPYNSSRLALFDSWSELAKAQAGVLLVAVPATNAVLYLADDSPAGVDALRAVAKDDMTRAANPLSDVLLRWTATGWVEVD